MSHDTHFLERLSERTSLPHMELAMSIYRDKPLVADILRRADLKAGEDRVAISLGSTFGGPFVIVGRDGEFITCLGEGMTLAPGVQVISRERLDVIIEKMEDVRERIARANEVGTRGKKLFATLQEGPDMSREDFLEISDFVPLFVSQFTQTLFQVTLGLEKSQEQILVTAARNNRRLSTPLFRAWWNLIWSLSHLTLLVTLDWEDRFAKLPPEITAQTGIFLDPCCNTGSSAMALRALWGVANAGEPMLEGMRERFLEGEHHIPLMCSILAMGAMRLRHPKLGDRITKILRTPLPKRQTDHQRALAQWAAGAEPALDIVMKNPQAMYEAQLTLARDLYMKNTARLPAGSPWRFESLEQVPEDLAHAMAARQDGDMVNDNVQTYGTILSFLPWLARAKAADFYFPAEFLKEYRQPWEYDDTYQMLDRWNTHTEPVRAEKKPGRNDPCSCGSGKKYKKCHGA